MALPINDAKKIAEADSLYFQGVQLLAESTHQTADEARQFFKQPFTMDRYFGISIIYDEETDNLLVKSDDNTELEVAVCYFRGCTNAVAMYNIGCEIHRDNENPSIEIEDEASDVIGSEADDEDEGSVKCDNENQMDIDSDSDSLPDNIPMEED